MKCVSIYTGIKTFSAFHDRKKFTLNAIKDLSYNFWKNIMKLKRERIKTCLKENKGLITFITMHNDHQVRCPTDEWVKNLVWLSMPEELKLVNKHMKMLHLAVI